MAAVVTSTDCVSNSTTNVSSRDITLLVERVKLIKTSELSRRRIYNYDKLVSRHAFGSELNRILNNAIRGDSVIATVADRAGCSTVFLYNAINFATIYTTADLLAWNDYAERGGYKCVSYTAATIVMNIKSRVARDELIRRIMRQNLGISAVRAAVDINAGVPLASLMSGRRGRLRQLPETLTELSVLLLRKSEEYNKLLTELRGRSAALYNDTCSADRTAGLKILVDRAQRALRDAARSAYAMSSEYESIDNNFTVNT